MDLATNSSVQVDASQPMGLLITNGEFTAFRDPTGIGKAFVDPTVGPPDPAQVTELLVMIRCQFLRGYDVLCISKDTAVVLCDLR